MTNAVFSLTTPVRRPSRLANALRIFLGAVLAWSWLDHPVHAQVPRPKAKTSAMDILRYGDPTYGVPVVEFSCVTGKLRGELLRPAGECALPDDEGRALQFTSARARVVLPGGKLVIAITRWPNAPKVVRLLTLGDTRLLPLAADRSIAGDAFVTVGDATQAPEGKWTLSFEAALPPGEYAILTGSPTIETILYDFSVDPAPPTPPRKTGLATRPSAPSRR
jgi:hypothetical protein